MGKSQKVIIRVAAGVIRHQQRILITQRRRGDSLGGLWEFPGGKLECGETYRQALRRELQEEIGVRVQVGILLRTIQHAYPRRLIRIRFFEARITSGQVKKIEVADFCWVTPAELSDFTFPPADLPLLEQLQKTETQR